ncbi:GNAT family N-acetyltransferase [Facklamia sp. P9177]|uniref:GNAT family N-acetyltransferase n=1 Tax=Facklamia sp. P9177 TaxID=3421945 RepID=UPI003D18630C
MRFYEGTLEDIKNNKNTILNLMIQSLKITFSSIEISKDQINSRFNNLITFIENGEAKILLAEDNKIICGYLWYFYKKKNLIHINSFVVDSKYRGKGIGSTLYNMLYDNIQTKNAKLELQVSSNNKEAINFYESKGFSPVKLTMTKSLNDKGG